MELATGTSPEKLAILVIGSDTLIEALPARPIQLAIACGALGFDLVVPASWGDELVAEAALRALEAKGDAPMVLCCCPLVRQRLLHTGADLVRSLLSLASPPVAVARHLRTTLGDRVGSVTFVGLCPEAKPPEYDVSYAPQDILGILRARGIQVNRQPDVFYDRIPADRRRYVSLPGGCPSPEVLWQRCNGRALAQLEGDDFPVDLAQHLLSGQSVLVDPGTAVGCSCSGVTHVMTGPSARVAVSSLEPPRSTTPIMSEDVIGTLRVEVAVPEKVVRGDSVDTQVSGRPPMAVTPEAALRARQRHSAEGTAK